MTMILKEGKINKKGETYWGCEKCYQEWWAVNPMKCPNCGSIHFSEDCILCSEMSLDACEHPLTFETRGGLIRSLRRRGITTSYS